MQPGGPAGGVGHLIHLVDSPCVFAEQVCSVGDQSARVAVVPAPVFSCILSILMQIYALL